MDTPALNVEEGRSLPKWIRIVAVVGLLYLFLVGVKSLESGIKAFGADASERLFSNISNPVAGLFAGVLATVLVQSSSVTTSTIVGLVGGGVLPLSSAVPMIMGANIGTTVTNTLVSVGHIRQGQEFKRAFAGATVHDFFNLLTVAIALPLELATGFLSKSAAALTEVFRGQDALSGAAPSSSPIKEAVGYPVDVIKDALEGAGMGTGVEGTLLLVVGIGLIFVALAMITRNMKMVMAGRIEQSLNTMLDKGAGIGAMVLGMAITVAVQSSSITTSILIPMVGAGILTLKNAFPVTLGANVGTTITALLASVAAESPEGLTIALVHTLFNLFGILVFYPLPAMRNIPIRLAVGLAELAQKNKGWVLGYVVGLFVVLPLATIAVLR
ncbi:MAG: Na/Pi symporter [Acidimicrobiia bacterium]|nr:Na/Pi symporter [Acidimicrobiia bacterium]